MNSKVNKEILKHFYLIIREVNKYLSSVLLDKVQCRFKKNVNGAKEVVTKLDIEIEEICVNSLGLYFPDFPIVSEENYNNTFISASHFFVVDPIDGTLELLQGGYDWSVSIAAIDKNETQVGILYFPKKNITLHGVKDEGVWLNGEKITSKIKSGILKIGVSPRQILESNFRENLMKNGLKFIEIPHCTPKILAIVLGQINAAAYLPQYNKGVKLWDYAAASLMIEELGGKLTSLLSGKRLDHSGKKIFHQDGWLATDKSCNHINMLDILKSIHIKE